MSICEMAPLFAHFRQSVSANALRSYLAEFISTFFYVLAVVEKFVTKAGADSSSLAIVGIANAFALSSTVYISGGHVNPAVTFAVTVGGHISLPTAMFYWTSQLLASVVASLLLKATTVSQRIPTFTIVNEMTGFGASMLEGLLTFGLVYTMYAAGDRRRGAVAGVGPLVIGLMGAMSLAAGPFSGGAMNPASAFGPAVVAGSFKNQAVYWVGPLTGAAVAGLLYDNFVFPAPTADSVGGNSERADI